MRKGDKRLKYEDRKEIEKMKNDGVMPQHHREKQQNTLRCVHRKPTQN